MKTVVLFASPHPQGACAALERAFLSALPPEASIERFSAYDMSVLPCDGCGACAAQYVCPHGDMDALLEAIAACNVLLICSPVYHLSFPAPLKAIFDRTQRCFEAERRGESPFAGKERRAVLLLSAGAPSERGEVILRQLRWILPPLHTRLCATVVAASTDRCTVGEETLSQAAAAARAVMAEG